jgi:hypothetical protein
VPLLPRSGFVQQIKARGLRKAVTFFIPKKPPRQLHQTGVWGVMQQSINIPYVVYELFMVGAMYMNIVGSTNK